MAYVAAQPKSLFSILFHYGIMAVGAFLAAFAIEVFLIPNNLIDGGVVGIAMLFGEVFGWQVFPPLLLILNIPFLYLAYKNIGKSFLIHMLMALLLFFTFIILIGNVLELKFDADPLEVIVIGGAILGVGIGLIIRVGGCLDGTEILGLIINRSTGITVGQVVLFCNVFVFGSAGFVFGSWHTPMRSLITYIVVIKIMDAVIVGLDETKSVMIISSASKAISDRTIKELGLGVTVIYGRGGFSGKDQEILYVTAERLQLSELKELVFSEDPKAFMAIENLHEVANGMQARGPRGRKRIQKIVRRVLAGKS